MESIGMLARYGLSEREIKFCSKILEPKMVPFVMAGVAETDMMQGANLLIVAPNGPWIPFLMIVALLRHVRAGKKAIILVSHDPEHEASLAHRFRDWLAQTLDPLDVRSIAAASMTEADTARLIDLDFDLALTTPGVLKSAMDRNPQLMPAVGMLAVGTLDFIYLPELGPPLRALVDEFLQAKSVQLVCAAWGETPETRTQTMMDLRDLLDADVVWPVFMESGAMAAAVNSRPSCPFAETGEEKGKIETPDGLVLKPLPGRTELETGYQVWSLRVKDKVPAQRKRFSDN